MRYRKAEPMDKRRLLVEQPFGARYCCGCELWLPAYGGRLCLPFYRELELRARGWLRCQQCLEAERKAGTG